ncbi:hypothetical protein TSOC_009486 [Tetrabaena socialis]|uniref:Uncharacterized protein n=1 Tax=Tetrabaena socialis TaxID=47790 RepID=A0A2J7ZVQ0_9CHLO|nr:hypothetical protein TSOC_009486 [Tetrabaena socialis]|eukprot:PNH04346.1 hypothetical protein TSOC_009486 [Tetrabaena socialis]
MSYLGVLQGFSDSEQAGGISCGPPSGGEASVDFRLRGLRGLVAFLKDAAEEVAVAALLEAVADVRVKDLDGDTPLHLAGEFGHVEAVGALLQAGFDLLARDGHACQ